jgi:single-strand DNA-binding protein
MKGTCEKIILIGNLGKDPEVRYTSKGTPVATLSLAIHNSVRDKNGEYQDVTEWRYVKVFGRLAEFVRDHAKKGAKVMVEPKGHTRKWQDKVTGQNRSMIEYISNTFQFMSSAAKQSESQAHQTPVGDDSLPDDYAFDEADYASSEQ